MNQSNDLIIENEKYLSYSKTYHASPCIMQSCIICGMEYENTTICTLCGGSVNSIPKDSQDEIKLLEKRLPFDILGSPVDRVFFPILFDIKYAPQYPTSPIILFGIDYAPN